MNHRSRPLLDLAHELHTCTNCDRWVGTEALPDGCEPAHENGIEAGKGLSIKAQDARHAALCHACHTWYDSAGGAAWDPSHRYVALASEKAEMWIRAHLRTFDEYWRRGWLAVVPARQRTGGAA